VLAAARDLFLARGYAGTTVGALADPHRRLDRLVELSCETLARISPVHTVLRARRTAIPSPPGCPPACSGPGCRSRPATWRPTSAESLRPGLTLDQAAERYSALVSRELYHLLTVERR